MHNKFLWQSETQINVIGNLWPVSWRSNTFNNELTGGHSVMMSWLFTLYKCQQHSSFKSFTALDLYFLPFIQYILHCVQGLMSVFSSGWFLCLNTFYCNMISFLFHLNSSVSMGKLLILSVPQFPENFEMGVVKSLLCRVVWWLIDWVRMLNTWNVVWLRVGTV